MDLPIDPVHLTAEEILAVLHAGHRAALATGPEAAVHYLQQILKETLDLPHSVVMVVYDLLSEAQAELMQWDACSASLAMAQRERRLAQLSTGAEKHKLAPQEVPVPLLPEILLTDTVLPSFSAVVLPAPPPAKLDPVPPEPKPAPVAPLKRCCLCGKDVTHRSRRKDPATQTYLCSECFGSRPDSALQTRPRLQRPPLQIALIVLAALVLAGLLVASLGSPP
jgi:hypothetical protein